MNQIMNKEATELLASALEKDANDQDLGQIENLGMQWDNVYGQILSIDEINQPLYNLAFRFWDDWADAANHEWKYYEPIKEAEWPSIAREIACSLRSQVLPTNPLIIEKFQPKQKDSLVQKVRKRLHLKENS